MEGLVQMIPTDLEIADLLIALYKAVDDPQAGNVFAHIADLHGIVWGYQMRDDCEVVAFRGSKTPEDWLLDSAAVPMPYQDLGLVHAGFLFGMPDVLNVIKPIRPLVVCGHSLGAARASIFTGLALAKGHTVARRVCFGEPNAGMRELANVVKQAPGVSYRNREGWQVDLVTVIPFVPPTFCHPTSPVVLEAHADPDEHTPFRLHHMTLYRAALAASLGGGDPK